MPPEIRGHFILYLDLKRFLLPAHFPVAPRKMSYLYSYSIVPINRLSLL
jgi:hypothetical protein